MRKATLILISLAAISSAFGQTITRTELAKDNGKNKPGQVVKSLSPTDNPFHCVLHFKPLPSAMVFTATLIAVRAADVKDYKVATTNISAASAMDLVDFKFSLPRNWPVGSYRIDLKVNNRPLTPVTFEIK